MWKQRNEMTWIPVTSFNRSWNIYSQMLLFTYSSHPQPCLRILHRLLPNNFFRDLADNTLETLTLWKRGINANERRRNAKRARWTQQQLYGIAVWTQPNEKRTRPNDVDAQWERNREAVTSHSNSYSTAPCSLAFCIIYKDAAGQLLHVWQGWIKRSDVLL